MRALVTPAPRRLSLRGLVAAIVALGLLVAAPAMAAEPVEVPASVTWPLGVEAQPAVIAYSELIKAADRGRVNAAVVDTANYWVAAVDDRGRLVAAPVPRPRPGDFSRAVGEAGASGLPGPFALADTLREDGVAVLKPAHVAGGGEGSPSALSRMASMLAFPLILVLILVTVLVVRRMVRGPGGGGGRAPTARSARPPRSTRRPCASPTWPAATRWSRS
jgi:hypothetical protein